MGRQSAVVGSFVEGPVGAFVGLYDGVTDGATVSKMSPLGQFNPSLESALGPEVVDPRELRRRVAFSMFRRIQTRIPAVVVDDKGQF